MQTKQREDNIEHLCPVVLIKTAVLIGDALQISYNTILYMVSNIQIKIKDMSNVTSFIISSSLYQPTSVIQTFNSISIYTNSHFNTMIFFSKVRSALNYYTRKAFIITPIAAKNAEIVPKVINNVIRQLLEFDFRSSSSFFCL